MAVYTVTFSGINYALASAAVGVPTMANPAKALILYVTGLGTFGARSPPTAPTGYGASIAPNTLAPDIAIYPRIAVAANESPSSINWASPNASYAFGIILTPPAGYVVPILADILDVPGVDYSSTSVAGFAYFTQITPSVAGGALLLGIGQRIKTNTTNLATVGSMVHDTAFGAPLFSHVATGVGPAVVVNGWQQTTPTATNTADTQLLSINDSSLNSQTVFLAIAAPVLIGSLGAQFALRNKRRIISTVSYRR